jgi:hypothetical protein
MDLTSLLLLAAAIGAALGAGGALLNWQSLASFALPTAADFQRARVTNPDQSEIVRQRFYDYQLYATAGVAQMTFFSAAVGQGLTTALGATAGTAKTLWDTNLSMPNTLPSGQGFMIESIEVVFFPGSVSTANTYTPQLLANFEATAADAAVAAANDVNTFYQSGMLELNVLSKNYLRETPLMCFPPKAWFDGAVAIASNAAATGLTSVLAVTSKGRPYYIEPTIALQPAVNFEVVLKWPAAVATPSGFNGRVGVILDGYFLRASQ